MTAWTPEPSAGTARWISREFAELLQRLPARRAREPARPDFDLLIVGSGYGGAIAAATFAGCRDAQGKPLRIAVLERGREYLPGSFPARMAELPTTLRGRLGAHRRGGEGLFDVRLGADLSVLLANGLGGGSLINAGVMEVPHARVFDARWPAALRAPAARHPYYERAKTLLGARIDGRDNTIATQAQGLPPKHTLLQQLADSAADRSEPRSLRPAALTIAMQPRVTVGGVSLGACKRCGDCASGCNHGAKESLDTNLLALAHRRALEIWCGATVLRLQRDARSGHWRLLAAHTDETLRRREGQPSWITAGRVILAAGALGSTEILLRSQAAARARARSSPLHFSPLLGKHFSGNGDMLAFAYAHAAEANAVADEDQAAEARGIGPTITGIIDTAVRIDGRRQPLTIEELALPGPLRRAAAEILATADILHGFGRVDASGHHPGAPADDPLASDARKLRRTSIFALMGDDGAGGVLRLDPDASDGRGDGALQVVWPDVGRLPLFEAQHAHLHRLLAAGPGGRLIANPLWRLLPESMEFLAGGKRGPLLSVHPLGGCRMGDSVAAGVVDDCGRVFDGGPQATGRVHDGLFVLDGAIIPAALGTNPALSIAALALRAAESLRAEWHWSVPALPPEPPLALLARPAVADIDARIRQRQAQPHHTKAEFRERLAGPLRLRDAGGLLRDCVLELTLAYEPLPLEQLYRPDEQGRLSAAQLQLEPQASALRVHLAADWEQLRQGLLREDEAQALRRQALCHPLSGTLRVFGRAPSTLRGRLWRALPAWLRQRGLRDMLPFVLGQAGGSSADAAGPGLPRRLLGALRLASRAGELRLFEYDLVIGEAVATDAAPRFVPALALGGGRLAGNKRITYARPSNPWRQLQELHLSALPGLTRARNLDMPILRLDLPYFAAVGAPLFRIVAQREHSEALADAAALLGLVLRMMLSIHLWNARKPDPPPPRALQRLPGALPGLPPPQVHRLEVDRIDGKPVEMLLTRYRTPAVADRGGQPVVLIHGYSASGTSFAHPSLKPSLAADLAQAGRDVWVLDLRSSAGLATATHPWTFERMAVADIPAAIDHVYWHSGERPVDVIAHCMGGAMLSMAVLSADQPLRRILSALELRGDDRFAVERRALPGRIRRAVLSQIGPAMVFSPENVFRSYLFSFVETLLGPLAYRFRPEGEPSLGDELLDRLLATLPYADEELRLENPLRGATGHLRTRHRLDALYGRTFSLRNLSAATLAQLDDFFGPLNLETLSQVLHFARQQRIANRAGRNRFVSREALQAHWRFPTLCLHGSQNGLADPATLQRVQRLLGDAGVPVRAELLPGYGHQDCLIGRRSGAVFARIRDFLDAAAPTATQPQHFGFRAVAPALGPLRGIDARGAHSIGVGATPAIRTPEALCLLPLQRVQGAWQIDHAAIAAGAGLLRRLRGDDKTDWFAQTLPAAIHALGIRHVATLLLYPQADCLGMGDAPWSMLAQEGGLQRLLAAAATPALTEARDASLSGALGAALLAAVTRMGNEALPAGVLRFATASTQPGLCLALGSCQYPPGILDRELSTRAWSTLRKRLDGADAAPTLAILTGDQVYTDATAGLFDPAQPDHRFRKPYEGWLGEAEIQAVLQRLPVATLPDDHEIENNWEPLAATAGNTAVRHNRLQGKRGRRSFLRYQRPSMRPPPRRASLSFDFSTGGVPLFMLDSRSEREPRHAHSGATPAMFRPEQEAALKAWLTADAQRGKPKLIVTPALLLPRRRRSARALLAGGQTDERNAAALRSDAWEAYPRSLYGLLSFIADEAIRGVVFLSGDEHLGLVTQAQLHGGPQAARGGALIHSIHAPGLYTPYQFANAQPADFLLAETLRFRDQAQTAAAPGYRCEIKTRVVTGSGFVLIDLQQQANGWTLRYEFDGAPPETVALMI